MHITIISVVAAIVAPVLAGPITSVEKRHVIVEKRQLFDPKQVQKLASEAGIRGLPADPAIWTKIFPPAYVSSIEAALPNSAAIQALESAAPVDFLSRWFGDAEFANAIGRAMEAGSYPSWFTALPTSVQDYYRTYTAPNVFNEGCCGVSASTAAVSGLPMFVNLASVTASGLSSASAAVTSSATAAQFFPRPSETTTATTSAATTTGQNRPTNAAGVTEASGLLLTGIVGTLSLILVAAL